MDLFVAFENEMNLIAKKQYYTIFEIGKQKEK